VICIAKEIIAPSPVGAASASSWWPWPRKLRGPVSAVPFSQTCLRVADPQNVHHGPPLPTRVLNAWEMGAENELIAEASVTGGVLFVLSCALERLDVPIRKIPALAGIRADDLRLLEVSPDGGYLHWPRGDIHLDLGSLRYVIDPVWRAKADAARVGHHEQFGNAVRAVREARRIPQNAIEGLSARHVRRIERGMFPKVATLRLLARAHGMELDHYLTAVAAEAERYESLRE